MKYQSVVLQTLTMDITNSMISGQSVCMCRRCLGCIILLPHDGHHELIKFINNGCINHLLHSLSTISSPPPPPQQWSCCFSVNLITMSTLKAFYDPLIPMHPWHQPISSVRIGAAVVKAFNIPLVPMGKIHGSDPCIRGSSSVLVWYQTFSSW